MENLAPPLELCFWVRTQMFNGGSILSAIKTYKTHDKDWSETLQKWLINIENQNSTKDIVGNLKSYHRKILIEVLENGIKGHSIQLVLKNLEDEMINYCELELENFNDSLQFKMMIPVLLFIFPAYLIALLGPVLNQILESMRF